VAALRPADGLLHRGPTRARRSVRVLRRLPTTAGQEVAALGGIMPQLGPRVSARPARLAFLVSVLLHAAALLTIGDTASHKQRVEPPSQGETHLEVRMLPASAVDAPSAETGIEPETRSVSNERPAAEHGKRDIPATRVTPLKRNATSMRDTALERRDEMPVSADPSPILIGASSAKESAPEEQIAGGAPSPGAVAATQRAEKSSSSGTAAAPTGAAYLQSPEPVYPESAREDGEEGVVVLRVRISVDGLPVEVLIRRSSGVGVLDRAALSAVKHWKFAPATVAGKPIESWMDVPIRFRLT